MTDLVFWVVVLVLLAFGWHYFILICKKNNRVDWGRNWLNVLDGLNRIFCRKYHRLIFDTVHLPQKGGAIIVSNHLSGLDPLLLLASIRRPLRFLVALEEYDRWWLHWLLVAVGCIPVNRSRNAHKSLYAARQALDAGEVLVIFPQGGIRALDRPPIKLKRGAVFLASLAEVPIIPIMIEGVRGQGRTVSAVFLRSTARLRVFETMFCSRGQADSTLESITNIIYPSA